MGPGGTAPSMPGAGGGASKLPTSANGAVPEVNRIARSAGVSLLPDRSEGRSSAASVAAPINAPAIVTNPIKRFCMRCSFSTLSLTLPVEPIDHGLRAPCPSPRQLPPTIWLEISDKTVLRREWIGRVSTELESRPVAGRESGADAGWERFSHGLCCAAPFVHGCTLGESNLRIKAPRSSAAPRQTAAVVFLRLSLRAKSFRVRPIAKKSGRLPSASARHPENSSLDG